MNTTNQGISFPATEHKILKFWQEADIFAKSLQKTKGKPTYAFYDGPPFATGLPHHGHLLASTIKDIIPRYFTMCGYHVPRRFGWDCHGLPIEYEIDKKLGMPAHEVVQQRGIAAYNQECRSIVQRYAEQWRQTITRIGRWVDFDNDYKTMDPAFMESVWWVCRQLWDKGLIYRGLKVVPYSTALATVLSNFEAGSNYQDLQDPAVTVLLKLCDEPVYLAIWTTTPWTLPSNLGVCVNAAHDYVTVKDKEKNIKFIIAQQCLPSLGKDKSLEILRHCKGAELVGKRYEPAFPYFKSLADSGAFQVYSDDFVTFDEGTGLVHMAPAFGEDDFRVMRSAGMTEIVCPIDEQGKFIEPVSDFVGLHVKAADKKIIQYLKTSKLLYDHRTIVHSYPCCPRSDTPLIYRTIDSWYVKVETLKARLLAANEKVDWIPAHIKHGRFGNWLEGARDWAISRNRVWGTPLPIWVNDTTEKLICIGSIKELEDLSGKTITNLHREHIDAVTFTIPDEKGTYRRIDEVLDCWFESGSMPYAQLHYPFKNKDYFKKAFPADFIAEGRDQTRGWFYTLMVLAVALFDQPAFKHAVVSGMVLAEDGKKMSKRLQNYTPPDQLMETYGADPLRLYLINSGLVRAEEQRFTDHGVKEMVRRTLLPWYNAFKFLQTYATVDHWDPARHQQQSDNIVDCWLISRMQSIKIGIAQHMQAYQLYYVVPELLHFIDELTNCYVRLNRQRFWEEGLSQNKQAAYTTLFNTIREFSICMAPFAPFLSEHIYQELQQLYTKAPAHPESVHLCDYPQAQTDLIDTELERAVARMQQVILLGRQKRNEHKIKVKIPLRQLTIIHKDKMLLEEIEKLEDYIKKELNVKDIHYESNEEDYIKLYAKPDSPRLGKRLQKRFPHYQKLITALTPAQIETLEAQGSIQLEDEHFSIEDMLIFREAKEGTEVLTDRYISIQLNTDLDQSLLDEGLAREVINRIQKSRKLLNFNVDDRIHIKFSAPDELAQIIKRYQDTICEETLALSLTAAEIDEAEALSFNIDDYTIKFMITRASND